MIGIPASGDFGLYLGSGPERPGDLIGQLASTVQLVPIDICRGGVVMDLTVPAVISALMEAAALERCRFVVSSTDCSTYSCVHFLPDAGGNPGAPCRDTDHPMGFCRSDGSLPEFVRAANVMTAGAAEILCRDRPVTACARCHHVALLCVYVLCFGQ